MCCGGGDQPTTDPGLVEAAKTNAATAKEALAFYKDTYTNDLLPMQKENQALAKRLIDQYITSQQKQDNFADEQNAYYKETFQPIEKKMAAEANTYDSADNVSRRMGIAAANVNQQFSNAEQQSNRTLSRYGISPNSSAFAATNAKLMRDKALGAAGAATGAAFDTQDKAIALRAGAANFGRNMPNTAATYYNNSNAAGSQAMNTSSQALTNGINTGNYMSTGYNTSIAGNSSAGSLYGQDFSARMQGYAADQNAMGGLFQGVGTAIGMIYGGPAGAAAGGAAGRAIAKADGGEIHEGAGHVRGIGGPVDDKIPAMLSNGEYVIPADVVKAKGVEFFDKLKAKYHVPAETQRRYGIHRG